MSLGLAVGIAHAAPPPAPAVAPEDTEAYWVGLLDQGRALYAAGRYVEAETPMRKLYEASLAALGPDLPLTQLAGTNLGAILTNQGRYDEALAVLLSVLQARTRVQGEGDPETLTTASTYAQTLRLAGRLEEARVLHDRTLVLLRLTGREQDVLEEMNNLAAVLQDMGRTAEAESLYRQAWSGLGRLRGENDSNTLVAASNVGMTLLESGRPEEAEPILRRIWLIRQAALGDDHPATLRAAINLAGAMDRLERSEEAAVLQRDVWERLRKVLGDTHPVTLTAANNYAGMLDPVRDAGRREAILRRILEVRQRDLGEDHPDTLSSINNLGLALGASGRTGEAEVLVSRSTAGFATRLTASAPPPLNLITAYGNLGKLRLDLGRPQGAYEAYDAGARALQRRFRDRRATGGSQEAREGLRAGRAVFLGQVRAGWSWAHQP
ncbi:MAG: tetratricopeptide repeat protein [Caulobacter sp.]|nr:tetratricopeptide repeat protein [Caulobacter sp.]